MFLVKRSLGFWKKVSGCPFLIRRTRHLAPPQLFDSCQTLITSLEALLTLTVMPPESETSAILISMPLIGLSCATTEPNKRLPKIRNRRKLDGIAWCPTFALLLGLTWGAAIKLQSHANRCYRIIRGSNVA